MSEADALARLQSLQRIAGSLSSLLTPQAVADVILSEVAPELGGVSRALWLANDDGSLLELVRPDDYLRAKPFASLATDGEMPGAVVFRTGDPLFIATKAERDRRFPVLVDVGPQVAIAVLPLNNGTDTVGVIALSYDEEHEFSADERRFFIAVADLASQALARGRLHARQVEVARALQQTLLPPDLPAVRGADLAASYHPAWEGAEVGGDFYDVIPLPCGDRWMVMIGDVCGTGPAAAGITAQVRYTARTAAALGMPLDRVVGVINDALLESIGDDRFCTLAAAIATPTATGLSMQVVCAGHPCPVVVRADGRSELVPSNGSLVGVFADARFAPQSLELDAGDTLVLYTDGVTEARRQGGDPTEFFESDRVLAAVGSGGSADAASVVAGLESALLAFVDGRLTDDVAIVAVRATPPNHFA